LEFDRLLILNKSNAHLNGISACDKGNSETAIAFKPELFVEYIKNLERLHQLTIQPQDLKIFAEVTDNQLIVNQEILEQVSQPRQTVVLTISKKLRDSSFKSRVLTAYHFKCAFCGIQLKLVDAAHILPVCHDHSTDETCNGIALCALHHRAYDNALVTFNPVFQIFFNEDKMEKLKKIGLDSGLEKFIQDLRPLINLPPARNDRPNINYIVKANEIRGWNIK
jgi:putative restriction endonuclease